MLPMTKTIRDYILYTLRNKIKNIREKGDEKSITKCIIDSPKISWTSPKIGSRVVKVK